MTRKGWTVVVVAAVLVTAGFLVTTAVGKEAKEKGYLGVYLGEVTSDIAADYGVQPGAGVLVEGVSPGAPADEAGLRENDIIIRVNKITPTGPEEFRKQIANLKPDDNVDLVYLRGGKEKAVQVKLAKRSDEEFDWGPGPRGHRFHIEGPPWDWHKETAEPQEKVAFAGIIVQGMGEGLANYFQVEKGKGVLITDVFKDSPAERAGLKAGDVILSIAGKPVTDERDSRQAIRDQKPGAVVDVEISRNGMPLTLKMTLGEQVGWNHPFPPGFNFSTDMPGFTREDMERVRKELNNLKIQIDGLPDIDVDVRDIHAPPVRVRIERHESVEKQDEDQTPRKPQRLRDRLGDAFQQLSREVNRLIDRAFV